MSFAVVRPHFREIFKGLDFDEFEEAFDLEFLADNNLEDSFHMESLANVGTEANQQADFFTYPILVRVFKQGFGDAFSLYDAVDLEKDRILAEVLKPSNRYQEVILKVSCDSIVVVPLDESNDDAMIMEFSFTVTLACDFRE